MGMVEGDGVVVLGPGDVMGVSAAAGGPKISTGPLNSLVPSRTLLCLEIFILGV
uniref:SC35-like splicing factor family protein n=1 Tax=Rhizophora mucronata TaxID=61149 RepID=A0A2P2IKY8_RHIMU